MLYVNGQPVGGGGGNANEKELTYAQYQALSEAQKNNGTTYYITDINGDGSQFQPVIYSETEREIGVWADGKPIYQRVIILSDLMTIPSNTWTDIDNSDWTFVDKYIYCTTINGAGSCLDFIGAKTNESNNKLQILSARPSNITVKYIVIQYTKTTDTAGSGTWTPQGVPAVHYSTDEHIIGTWIDGKTLYEKTIEYSCENTSDAQRAYTGNNNDVIVQIPDYYFINGQNVQIRSSWSGTHFWDFISGLTSLTVKKNTNDTNWQSGVRFIATIQYTKSS